MPTRDPIPPGAPCWADLATSDPRRAVDFYGQVFRWEAEEPDPTHGGYFNFHRGGARLAGAMAAMANGASDVWACHFSTADGQRTLARVQAEGGQVIVPGMPVGDLGVMSVVVDPAGSAIGFWQPGQHRGFALSAAGRGGVVVRAAHPGLPAVPRLLRRCHRRRGGEGG